MNTLVINPGSTGIKYKIVDADAQIIDAQSISLGALTEKLSVNHAIDTIIIRVVHGGNLSSPQRLTSEIKQVIRDFLDFAPIHNKLSLEVITLLEERFPHLPVYVYFDTSFHADIPAPLRTYAIPQTLASKHKLYRYGFHGIAIESALSIVKEKMHGKLPEHIVCVHLGGGSSVTAVAQGTSIYTSMGLTPLSGLMMITRSGDVDPEMPRILSEKEQLDMQSVSNILNHQSGFLGLTGSTDTLRIFSEAQEGHPEAKLSFDMYVSAIVREIFSAYAELQQVDALIFSGGIGYGNEYLRSSVIAKLSPLAISPEAIFVVDVNEELLMYQRVRDTY